MGSGTEVAMSHDEKREKTNADELITHPREKVPTGTGNSLAPAQHSFSTSLPLIGPLALTGVVLWSGTSRFVADSEFMTHYFHYTHSIGCIR